MILITQSLFSLMVMPVLLTGQLNLVEHLVDGNIHGTASLYGCDLDNDGDIDILGASYEENTIDWWRNDGGTPIQWTRRIIASNFIEAGSVYAADIDGDGLTDVLGVARVGDEVAWWKNTGGSVPWPKYVIRANYDFAHEVYACDLDEDGDIDVFGASTSLNQITWWRNEGGQPVQWTEQAIGINFLGAKSVHVADIDGDGVLDVVGAAINDHDITWWRNEGGNPIVWTEYLVDGNFGGAHRVQAIDIDLDGKTDILGAAYVANQIAWWHNDGGQPVQWTKQTIGTEFVHACVAQSVDLDGDGDMDVVATAQDGNQVAWWQNDGGQPIQWTKFIIDSLVRTWPLFCCDLDQDSDIDVIAASGWAGTNEVKWYENQGSAIEENKVANLHPDMNTVTSHNMPAIPAGHKCRVFDITGCVVTPSYLAPGIYYLEIDGTISTRLIIIR